MTAFKKNQTVYVAKPSFAHRYEAHRTVETQMVVVSRVVDSCGKKQMSFFDGGNDHIYGRRVLADASGSFYNVFSTPEEAFAALEGFKAQSESRGIKVTISADVLPDSASILDACIFRK